MEDALNAIVPVIWYVATSRTSMVAPLLMYTTSPFGLAVTAPLEAIPILEDCERTGQTA